MNETLTDLKDATITEEHQMCAEAIDGHVLKGVKLCGMESQNGAVYGKRVFSEACHLYDNVPVYVDHNSSKRRLYTERLGHVRDPRACEDGLRGDLHLNPHHAMYESVKWDYEHGSRVGLSHVAHCSYGKGSDGREYISRINKVHSVDLVDSPATVKTLREEAQVPVATIVETDKELQGLREQVKALQKTVDEMKTLKDAENSQGAAREKELAEQLKLALSKPKPQSSNPLLSSHDVSQENLNRTDRKVWLQRLKTA